MGTGPSPVSGKSSASTGPTTPAPPGRSAVSMSMGRRGPGAFGNAERIAAGGLGRGDTRAPRNRRRRNERDEAARHPRGDDRGREAVCQDRWLYLRTQRDAPGGEARRFHRGCGSRRLVRTPLAAEGTGRMIDRFEEVKRRFGVAELIELAHTEDLPHRGSGRRRGESPACRNGDPRGVSIGERNGGGVADCFREEKDR